MAVGEANTVVPDPHPRGTVRVVEGATGAVRRASAISAAPRDGISAPTPGHVRPRRPGWGGSRR